MIQMKSPLAGVKPKGLFYPPLVEGAGNGPDVNWITMSRGTRRPRDSPKPGGSILTNFGPGARTLRAWYGLIGLPSGGPTSANPGMIRRSR